jgi:hypothetical protein
VPNRPHVHVRLHSVEFFFGHLRTPELGLD